MANPSGTPSDNPFAIGAENSTSGTDNASVNSQISPTRLQEFEAAGATENPTAASLNLAAPSADSSAVSPPSDQGVATINEKTDAPDLSVTSPYSNLPADANSRQDQLKQVPVDSAVTSGASSIYNRNGNLEEATAEGGRIVAKQDGTFTYTPPEGGTNGDGTPSGNNDTTPAGNNNDRAPSSLDSGGTRSNAAETQVTPRSTDATQAPTQNQTVGDTVRVTTSNNTEAPQLSDSRTAASSPVRSADTTTTTQNPTGDAGTRMPTQADTVNRAPAVGDNSSSTSTTSDAGGAIRSSSVDSSISSKTGGDQVQSTNSSSGLDQGLQGRGSGGDVRQTTQSPDQSQTGTGRSTIADSTGSTPPSKVPVDSTQKVGDAPVQTPRPTDASSISPSAVTPGKDSTSTSLGGGNSGVNDIGIASNQGSSRVGDIGSQIPSGGVRNPEGSIDTGKGGDTSGPKPVQIDGGSKSTDFTGGAGQGGSDLTGGQGVRSTQNDGAGIQPTIKSNNPTGGPSDGTGVKAGQGDLGAGNRGGQIDTAPQQGVTTKGGADITSGQSGTTGSTPTEIVGDKSGGDPSGSKGGSTDTTGGQTVQGRGTPVDSVGTTQSGGGRGSPTDVTSGTPGKDTGGDRGGSDIGRGGDGSGKDTRSTSDTTSGDSPIVSGSTRQTTPGDKSTPDAGSQGGTVKGSGQGDVVTGSGTSKGGGQGDVGTIKGGDGTPGKSTDSTPGKTGDSSGSGSGGDQTTVTGKAQDQSVVKAPDITKTDKPEGGVSQGSGDSKLESHGDAGKADIGSGSKTQPTDAAHALATQTSDAVAKAAQLADANAGRGTAESYKIGGDAQFVSGATVRDALTNAGVDLNDKASRMQMLDVINKMQAGKLDQLDASGLKISQALAQLDANRLSNIQAWLTKDANGLLGKGATGANLASLFDASQRNLQMLAGKEGQAALGEIGRMLKDVTNATGGDAARELALKAFLSRGLGADNAELNVSGMRLMPGQEAALRNLQDRIDALRQIRGGRLEAGEKVEGSLRGGKFESKGETFGPGGKPTGRTDFGAMDDGSVRGAYIGRKGEERDADGKLIGRTDIADKLGDKREEDKERKQKEEEKEKEKEREAEAKRLSEAALAALATRKLKEDQEKAEKEKAQEKDKKDQEKRQKYTVREKDTLESIALAQLKDKKLAPLILEINKNLIPTRTDKGKTVVSLRPKMIIWLPTTTDIQSYRGRAMAGAVPQFVYDQQDYESPEAELQARYGEEFDKVDEGQSEADADRQDQSGQIGAAGQAQDADDAGDSRRQNIERLLGPLSRQPDTDQSGRLKYNVRLGDTLKSVSIRHPALGDVALWKLLAEVNNIPVEGKSGGSLKRGSQIYIPTAQEIEAFRSQHSLKPPKAQPVKQAQLAQAELVTRPCPGCGRLATLTAEICPGCGNPFTGQSSDVRDFSPEPAGEALNFSVPEDDATKSVLSAFGWSGTQKAPSRTESPPPTPKVSDSKPNMPPADPKESGKRGGLPVIKRVPAQQADDSHTAPVRKMPSGMPIARRSDAEPSAPAASPDATEGTTLAFSEDARLVKVPASSDGGYKTRLEVRHEEKWALIVLYEIYDDVSLHHEYTLDGRRKTFRIDLPPQAAQELAENDLYSNWKNYCARFLAGKNISD